MLFGDLRFISFSTVLIREVKLFQNISKTKLQKVVQCDMILEASTVFTKVITRQSSAK